MIRLIGNHKVREHNVEICLIKRNQYASHTLVHACARTAVDFLK